MTDTPNSWWGPVPDDPRMTDVSLKKRFAAELLRNPGYPHNVALGLINDPGIAGAAARLWPNDHVVLKETLRLQEEHGERAELPTKETVLREILQLGRATHHTVTDRLKAYALYGEMSGYTGRGAGQSPVVSVFANKVMMVKDFGSDDNWEDKAKKQQSGLVQAARDDAKRSETRH